MQNKMGFKCYICQKDLETKYQSCFPCDIYFCLDCSKPMEGNIPYCHLCGQCFEE